MNHVPTIVLEAGTRQVRVSDIPYLMALAVHPEPQQKVTLKAVTKAYLGPNGEWDGRTQPLSNDDMKLLVEILGTPPQPGEETTDEKWMAYVAGWDTSPRRPPWTPGRQCINAEFDAALLRADAEDRRRVELIKAIRAGLCVPLSHAGTPLDVGEREFLDLGHLSFEKFREYAEKVGILVRTESTVDAGEAVEEIAEEILNASRDQWEKQEHKEHRQPVARAFIERHVLDHLGQLVTSGQIVPRNPEGDIPLTGISDFGFACDLHWKITRNDAAKLLLDVSNHPIQNLEAAVEIAAKKSENNLRIREANLSEKNAAGRHTLEEAARMFANLTSESKTEVLNAFLAEVKDKRLPAYQPGRNFPSNPIPPRPFYEAYWDDLNRCLDRLKFRGEWRFPNPGKPDARRDLKSAKHERAILAAIAKLSLNPLALQRGTPGNPGSKAAIKSSLLPELTDRQFENAWQRLTAAGSIKYAP